jgi:dienelactone hydrolase
LEDVEFAIRKLKEEFGHVQLRGIIGHSFGGATAILAAKKLGLPAIALDPWIYPLTQQTIEQHTDTPIMCISSDLFWDKENVDKIAAACASSTRGVNLTIKSTSHHNYNDLPLMAPLLAKLLSFKFTWFTGRTDVLRVYQITREAIVEFVGHYSQSNEPIAASAFTKHHEVNHLH